MDERPIKINGIDVPLDQTEYAYQARLYYHTEPDYDNEPFCVWRSRWYRQPLLLLNKLPTHKDAQSLGELSDRVMGQSEYMVDMVRAICNADHVSSYGDKDDFSDEAHEVAAVLRRAFTPFMENRVLEDKALGYGNNGGLYFTINTREAK